MAAARCAQSNLGAMGRNESYVIETESGKQTAAEGEKRRKSQDFVTSQLPWDFGRLEFMTTQPDANTSTAGMRFNDEQRHALILRAWEAINAERELGGVLAAVSEVLVALVPFEGVALAPFGTERC